MNFQNFFKPLLAAGILLAATVPATLAQETEAEAEQLTEQQQFEAWAQDFLSSLMMQKGTIVLGDKLATIDTNDGFYFLSPTDGKRVLEEAWGNPPRGESLGMLFPARYTPLDGNSWGVDISFEELGYVNDEDATDIDYAELLDEMKSDTAAENEERLKQGYDGIELIGWAQEPYYDAESKKLHWAKELHFGDAEVNTLNYNVRILGRKGVLVLNFIASMDQLEEISNEIDGVLAATNFETGHRYADFDPDIDTVAAVGIGGLIAGKVLAKTGLLATGLLLLKKFWFVLAAAFLGLKKMITGRGKQEDGSEA